jgi:hypothetical protein
MQNSSRLTVTRIYVSLEHIPTPCIVYSTSSMSNHVMIREEHHLTKLRRSCDDILICIYNFLGLQGLQRVPASEKKCSIWFTEWYLTWTKVWILNFDIIVTTSIIVRCLWSRLPTNHNIITLRNQRET